MKARTVTGAAVFASGELYLFHPTDPSCPSTESLWGIFDNETDGVIYLESSSRDLHCYALWHPLPAEYRYGRLATRSELRDYAFNLAAFECRRISCRCE